MTRPCPLPDVMLLDRPGLRRTRIVGAAGAWLLMVSILTGCGSSSDNGVSAPAASPAPAAATPEPSGASKTADTELAQKAVTQINAIRATARNCGGVAYPAASPISWNSLVAASATGQAVHMQTTGVLSHTGSGGSTLGQRLSSAGYNWGAVGENIAFGYSSIEEVLEGWVASPGHCANLMGPTFAEIGIAQSTGSGETFWALVLARPRS